LARPPPPTRQPDAFAISIGGSRPAANHAKAVLLGVFSLPPRFRSA
jgi:hypothetical protein